MQSPSSAIKSSRTKRLSYEERPIAPHTHGRWNSCRKLRSDYPAVLSPARLAASLGVGETKGDNKYKNIKNRPKLIADITAMLASNAVHVARLLKGATPALSSKEETMAKKRKYAKSAGRDVESEMRRYKKGTAKSGRGGKGGKVKSRKQAIAIGLSKARKKGKRVPKKS